MSGTLTEAELALAFRRVKGVPFHVAIKALTGCEAIAIDPADGRDQALVNKLATVGAAVADAVKLKPIVRNRPNEVGNDIEAYIMAALDNVGLNASRPRSKAGRGQSSGYPDILVTEPDGRPTYLEAKTFSEATAQSPFRSFYLSPSENPKVSQNARHLLIGFEMVITPKTGGVDEYRANGFKLVDLYNLPCDVKHEFNSSNRQLYSGAKLLAHG